MRRINYNFTKRNFIDNEEIQFKMFSFEMGSIGIFLIDLQHWQESTMELNVKK